jgi:hypothetical protein
MIFKAKSVAGIKVSTELERMWDERVLVKKSQELETGGGAFQGGYLYKIPHWCAW